MESIKNAFFIPRIMSAGPTPVPNFALSAMAASVHYHRGPVFAEIMSTCRKLLPPVFGTAEEVLIFAGTGTLAMEGAISNFFNPGEEVLAINAGKFGARWAAQAKIYGLNVKEINVQRGHAVSVDEVKKNVGPNTRGILIHASETSTSVRHNVKAIAQIANEQSNCLCMVDAVTALGVFSTPMDKWGIDVMVGGSQKGFMLPPGLSFGAASKRAWAKTQEVKNTRYYMDWRKERKAAEENSGAFTSPVTLIGGLKSILEYMDEVGLENIYRKNWRLCFATRAAIRAMGLKLFVENDNEASAACTALDTEGVLSGKTYQNKYRMTLSGGQDELKGKIMRIGHIGYMDAWDVCNQLLATARIFEAAGKTINYDKVIKSFMDIAESEADFTPQDLK
jgi:aspartate aminotransferase-like enzyme